MPSSLPAVNATVQRRASFSRCRRYRYSLTRRFDAGSGVCLMIGLNPSVADHRQDDPTIRRCMQFAHDWGFQELLMVNLFAWRATQPRDLLATELPVGPRNMQVLKRAASRADKIVAAWGVHGRHRSQSIKVVDALLEFPLYCFGQTQNQEPLHPLYQRRDAELTTFNYQT